MSGRTRRLRFCWLVGLAVLAGAGVWAALSPPTGANAQSASEATHFDASVVVRTTTPVARDTGFAVGVSPAAGAHEQCSAARSVSAVVRTGRAYALVAVAELVQRPVGASADCAYEVSWPDNDVSGVDWVGDASHAADVTLSASDDVATNRYRLAADTTFAPAVSVAVPQIAAVPSNAGTVAGDNLFAGTQVVLTFARAPNADVGCSASTPVSVVYTVGVDGQVTGEHPTPLIDKPAGATTPCVYVFRAEPVVSSAAGQRLTWTLTPTTHTGAFHSESPEAQVKYQVGDITFAPDVTIAVPQIVVEAGASASVFAGLTFDVGFAATAASPPGCTAEPSTTYAYVVQPDGSVAGTPPSLIDRVVETAGDGTQSALEAACAYEVTFPAQSADRAWLSLSSASGLTDDETSAGAPAAGTTYDFVGITSPVELMVTSPTFTPPPGRVVSATISAVDGSASRCLVDDLTNPAAAMATKAVTLEADGGTTLAQQFRLTDLPAGATVGDDRCAYDVAWSVSDIPDATAIWTFASGDTSWMPAGDLGDDGALSAVYVEPVDEVFEATLELVVVPHVPEGTAFEVEVAPVSGAPSGCTAADTYVFTAPAVDGTNDRLATTDAAIELAHTVAGVVHHCAYVVGWPDDEQGAGTSFVPDASFTPGTTLDRDNPSVANRYADATQQLVFTASVEVVTTEPVTQDTVFVVDIVSAGGPASGGPSAGGQAAGCLSVEGFELTLRADSQTPSQVTQTLELVRRPARATAECAYELRWHSNEKGGTSWAPDETFAAGSGVGIDVSRSLSSRAASATMRYAPAITYFTPSLTLDVPWVDIDGDGDHDYAGARFEVRFERSADESCSPSQAATYEFDAAGGVAPVAPFELVDEHPMGVCTYGVAFASASVGGAAATLVVSEAPSDDDDVSGDANDAHATYREAVRRFDATLYLGGTHTVAGDGRLGEVVPAGTEFSVLVRPRPSAPAGCDADPVSTETHQRVVLAVAEPIDQRPYTRLSRRVLRGLVDRTGAGESCVYDVIWPVNEVGGTSFVRDIFGQVANTVSAGHADDVGAIAWYRDRTNAPTSFPASVRVRLSAAASTDLHFAVTLDPPDAPAGCSAQRRLTVTVDAGELLGREAVPDLVARPAGASVACAYAVTWPLSESGGTSYARDAAFDGHEMLTNIAGVARHQYAPVRRPPPVAGGGSGGGPSGGGSSGGPSGGSGGGSSGGGTSGGSNPGGAGSPGAGSSGAGSSGTSSPWRVTGALAPVSLTVAVPQRLLLPGDTTVELRVHAVGACAEDVDAFGGVPAEVGLIYAVRAQPDVTADVLGGALLRFAAHAERGDETRDCELRVTLLRAPIGCQLEGARQDTEGRLYVSVTPDDEPAFTERLSLDCVQLPAALEGFTLSCILYDECWDPDVTPDVTGITYRCLATGTCRP